MLSVLFLPSLLSFPFLFITPIPILDKIYRPENSRNFVYVCACVHVADCHICACSGGEKREFLQTGYICADKRNVFMQARSIYGGKGFYEAPSYTGEKVNIVLETTSCMIGNA